MQEKTGRIRARIECLHARLRFRLQRDPHLPFLCRALCRQAQKKGPGEIMNNTTNKEKQFDTARRRRIVIDGIPYTVMVFFRSDVKETGQGKIMRLAKREITNNLLSEA